MYNIELIAEMRTSPKKFSLTSLISPSSTAVFPCWFCQGSLANLTDFAKDSLVNYLLTRK